MPRHGAREAPAGGPNDGSNDTLRLLRGYMSGPLSDQTKDVANLAYFSEGLAVATGKRGDAQRSARLFGVAEGLLEEIGANVYNYYLLDRTLYDHTRTAVRSELGDAAFEEARERGREMSFEQAVEYAYEGDEPSPT